MKTKRKLIFAVSSLVFVLAIVSTAIVFVLAAISQSLSSNVKISYTSRQVAGVVSASYTLSGGTETDMTSDTGATTLEFNGNSTNAGGVLSPNEDVVLNAEQTSVVFKYSFTNTGDTNYSAMMTLSDDVLSTNISITYSRDGTSYYEYNSGVTVYNNTPDTPEYYYVKIEIIETSQNASFSGDFSWELISNPNDTVFRVGNIAYGELEDSFINNLTSTTIVCFVNDYTIISSTTNSNIIFTADKNVTITKTDGSTIEISKGEYVQMSEILS